eukprot:jgi/Mesvir1/14179/Mv09638-RA.1
MGSMPAPGKVFFLLVALACVVAICESRALVSGTGEDVSTLVDSRVFRRVLLNTSYFYDNYTDDGYGYGDSGSSNWGGFGCVNFTLRLEAKANAAAIQIYVGDESESFVFLDGDTLEDFKVLTIDLCWQPGLYTVYKDISWEDGDVTKRKGDSWGGAVLQVGYPKDPGSEELGEVLLQTTYDRFSMNKDAQGTTAIFILDDDHSKQPPSEFPLLLQQPEPAVSGEAGYDCACEWGEGAWVEKRSTRGPMVGLEYRGGEWHTARNLSCQLFERQWPNSHYFPHVAADSCRNPDADSRPWCFTMFGKRWDYCALPVCSKHMCTEGQCMGVVAEASTSIASVAWEVVKLDTTAPLTLDLSSATLAPYLSKLASVDAVDAAVRRLHSEERALELELSADGTTFCRAGMSPPLCAKVQSMDVVASSNYTNRISPTGVVTIGSDYVCPQAGLAVLKMDAPEGPWADDARIKVVDTKGAVLAQNLALAPPEPSLPPTPRHVALLPHHACQPSYLEPAGAVLLQNTLSRRLAVVKIKGGPTGSTQFFYGPVEPFAVLRVVGAGGIAGGLGPKLRITVGVNWVDVNTGVASINGIKQMHRGDVFLGLKVLYVVGRDGVPVCTTTAAASGAKRTLQGLSPPPMLAAAPPPEYPPPGVNSSHLNGTNATWWDRAGAVEHEVVEDVKKARHFLAGYGVDTPLDFVILFASLGAFFMIVALVYRMCRARKQEHEFQHFNMSGFDVAGPWDEEDDDDFSDDGDGPLVGGPLMGGGVELSYMKH